MLITLFTPTYNRAHLLSDLYHSIARQDFENFEWLIVDDGSTDQTREVVQQFINENKISIRYIHKPNGGKHTAVNEGVRNAKGELFLIVDSDDMLADDALNIIARKYAMIKDNPKVCGIIGLSSYLDGELVGSKFIKENWLVSFAEVYLKYKVKGDKAVAFKTETMRKFPFPEPQDIRFVFEDVVWHEMAKEYDVLAINKVLQKKEYLKEGISDSSYKKWYLKSLAFSFYKLIDNKTYPFFKYPKSFIWNYIHLAINSKLAGADYFSKLNLKDKMIYVLFYPRAFYSYRNMKKKLLTDD